MPVHLGGGCANLDDILALSRKRTIPVIEDACQSHLSEWRGKKVRSIIPGQPMPDSDDAESPVFGEAANGR